MIGLLDGPGVVKELDYGTYILLAPEWINALFPKAKGLPRASPGQARNERRPGSGNKQCAKPKRGVTIFLRYAAIPRPRCLECRL